MANVAISKSDNDKVATKGSPSVWQPFATLRGEIDRLFDDLMPGFLEWSQTPASPAGKFGVNPKVDVRETEKDYTISAELPGLNEDDVEVVLSGGTLTIKGEKSEQKEHKSEEVQWTERSYGSFRRTFQVPSAVDSAKVSAEFKKGVLKVCLPKSSEAQKSARKIEIKS